jgi:pimeloyl-ACP methyl ester carboxylesterase
MAMSRVIITAAGPVEIVHLPGDRPPVLFFPGGHCSATSDCGWELYTSLGHGIISFSRPGYGSTQVGRLTAAEFEPVVRDVCRELGVDEVAAVVGVSFGGLQAVHAASDPELAVPRLVLHSCAPSTRRYPDTRTEAIGGPGGGARPVPGHAFGHRVHHRPRPRTPERVERAARRDLAGELPDPRHGVEE